MYDDLRDPDFCHDYDSPNQEREQMVERIETLEKYMGQSGDFLIEILDQIYSTEELNMARFQSNISNLCDLLDVYFPKEHPQIKRRKSVQSIYAKELIELNQDCLRQLYR